MVVTITNRKDICFSADENWVTQKAEERARSNMVSVRRDETPAETSKCEAGLLC